MEEGMAEGWRKGWRKRGCIRWTLVQNVPLEQQLAGVLVKRGCRVRVDEQALANRQHVLDPHLGLPVLLQGVDADRAVLSDVRVKDLCDKEALKTRR